MMRLSGSLVFSLSVALVLVLGAAGLFAQGTTGTILGTVTDMSGAAVPDATVQVRNVGTGQNQSVPSDAQGRFRMADLGVGEYEVQASKTGFSTLVHKGVTLNVGAQTVVDFALPVGQQQQTVTVEGQVSQVETTNSAVASLVDQRQMSELPLNGRNFEQLIQLAPGVATHTAFQRSGFQGRADQYSVAGGRPEGQQILLDDENLVTYWNKGIASITGNSLGIEAIGEFQTLTNTFSSQFGGNGAVINAVSKSGTYTEADLSIAADAEATLPYLIEACKKLLTDDRKRAFQARGAKLAEAHNQALEKARLEVSYGWDASPISTARLSAELCAPPPVKSIALLNQ